MYKLFSFIAFALLAIPSLAGDFDFSSPRSTIKHHIAYLQDDNFHPDIAQLALDSTGVSDQEAAKLAIKLKQIFDGTGYRIELEDVPAKAEFKDSLKHHRFVIDPKFPQLYVYKNDKGEWKYAPQSIGLITEIHRSVYPFGTHLLLELFAKNGSDKIFGMYIYQYAGIMVIILICFVIHKILTYFFDKIMLRFLRSRGMKQQGEKYILPLVRPFSLFLNFLLALILVPALQLTVELTSFIIIAIKATLPFFWTIIFYRMVDVLSSYFEKVAEKTESTLDDQLVPLLRKALKVFVVIIGILVTLQNLNINVTALLTGLSIGGLAFALASQDMLKNFFGSLMIFIDKPFAIGDWVTGNGIDGDVEEVGFRSTRIRTFHNSLISVPNGVIADMTIDNMGLRNYRRYKTYLALTYDTPSNVLDLFTQGIRSLVNAHPACPSEQDRPFHVYVNSFGESSIDILVYIFFEVPDWGAELKARHEINLQMIELAEAMGIRFAFKTQTLHIEDFPERKSSTPLRNNISDVKHRMTEYLDQKKIEH